ncbi:MAG: hypothetical protein A2073_02380 [Deltaproteobacteria bacterium GWC2_42_11]|nr:MAG: hypothetical protein A2073_02380 [Deltaproteobacteria bacterium GWC2_42_11]HBO84560.1 hypothetical protein [Deltaproteobacteria bacterium]
MRASKFLKAAGVMFFLAVFACIYAGQANAGAEDGKKVFAGKKCGDCHQTEGTATEKTFADKLKKKGPDLWFAGSKFKKEWLAEWMQNPNPIRPLEYNSIEKTNPGNHPKLAKKESEDATEYLMTLKSKDVQEGVIQEGASNIQGKLAFEKKVSCFACHKYPKLGKPIGGLTGPSLADASKRLKGDWVYAYLKNPKVLIPVKRMPVYEGILNDGEMKGIAQYISTFK